MKHARCGFKVLLVILCLGPLPAAAQSGIAGAVTDSTSGVLPGVTVEARSPALIEQVRTTTTDGQGRYSVTQLRPGTYAVTFTLPGFRTVVREGIVLEADFTAPLNVQLSVSAVEETVTVTGQSPIVDVRTTTRREVITRQQIDALPTGRNYQTVMQTLPAVTAQNAKTDVGGSSTMSQGTGTAYGGLDSDFKLTVDGLDTSAGLAAGDRPGLYYNDGGFEESVYTVNAGGADTQTAGIKVNLIPKQGGNTFSGQFLTTYSNEHLQSDNLKDTPTVSRPGLYRAFDVNPSFGGPILRNRLWFFVSGRAWSYNDYVLNVVNPDGSRFHDSNLLQAYPIRLTTQVSRANKLTAAIEMFSKARDYTGVSPLVDLKASARNPPILQYYTQFKWTSTITNRTLFEAGFSRTYAPLRRNYQPDVRRPSATDPYGDVAKVDLVTQRQWNARNVQDGNNFTSNYLDVSLSRVTGEHNLKIGVQDRFATAGYFADGNASLTQRYRNGVPDSVEIYNFPIVAESDLDADLGLYVQDSWQVGSRLTLNLGLRYDFFLGSVPAQDSPAGRWVPARHFDAIDNLPRWQTVSPRVAAGYDLFGNAKTAVKGSVGRYTQQESTGFQETFNPLLGGQSAAGQRSSDIRTWRDANGDDIAQASELGPTTNVNFGVRRNRNPDPGLDRPFQLLYNATVQHELRPGLGVTVSYNRRGFYRQVRTDNLATSAADYAIITIPDPRGNGQTLPVYSLRRDLIGLVNELDINSPGIRRTYNGVDVGVSARFPNGGTLFGGSSTGRVRAIACELEDPNGTATTPPLRFCDQRQFNIPWLTTFKLAATYPVRYGIQVSGIFQSQPGNEKVITYSVSPTIAPGLTVATVSVPLTEPGSLFYARINTLDLSVARQFRWSRVRVRPKIDIFNSLNANPVVSEVTTFGSALGRPSAILSGRLVKFGATLDF